MKRALLPFLLAASTALALDVPYLSGRVVDRAGLLSSGVASRIEGDLARLEGETGAQVAVLTLPSLEGEPLEPFSIRVVDQWKLGTAKGDNGVLFLIAQDDRKLRIEVGRGLEGAIPDIYAKRILDDVVVPRFRQGQFEAGIAAGADAIGKLVRRETVPELTRKPRRKAARGPDGIFILFVVFIIIANFFGRRRGGRGGFWIGGLGGGGGFGSGGGFSGGGGSFGGGGSSSSW